MNFITRPFKKFLSPETKIVKHGKWYAVPPLAIITIGIIVAISGIFVSSLGFNLGLDFTGGQIMKVQVVNEAKYAETRNVVQDVLKQELGASAANRAFFQREDSTGGGIALTARYIIPKDKDVDEDEVNTKIAHSIEARLDELGLRAGDVKPANSISPSASSERLMNTFVAAIVSLIAIMIYMLCRKFKLAGGVAAIVGLMHDVIIMISLVAILRIQVNFIFVAAVITVVAYSLNNTLVLFDRMRDKEKEAGTQLSIEQMMDSSIKETFWRTTVTTITTLVPVIILCIFGVPSIREFALPIVLGLLAGTYSTICITSTLYVRFEKAKQFKSKTKVKNLSS